MRSNAAAESDILEAKAVVILTYGAGSVIPLPKKMGKSL
jgi:hypothetical protein